MFLCIYPRSFHYGYVCFMYSCMSIYWVSILIIGGVQRREAHCLVSEYVSRALQVHVLPCMFPVSNVYTCAGGSKYRGSRKGRPP